MSRRKSKRKGGRGRTILLVLVLAWLVFEGRFYLPKQVSPPRGIQPVEVEMQTTAYCHCRKCCSYKWFLFIPYQKTGFATFRFKQVGITSSGAIVHPGTIAADTSIYPYGTVMYVPGYGYGRVEDTGGAIKGRHIDLYRPNHWFARNWGVQTKKVKVWLPAKKEAWSFNPLSARLDVSTNPPTGAGKTDNETHLLTNGIATNEVPPMEDVAATNESLPQIPLP